MKDQISSKEKAKDALPLKTGSFPLRNSHNPEIKSEKVPISRPLEGASSTYSEIEEVIGTRKERRECAVGVRVTREMKEVLEKLAAKTRISESEIVFRILSKNLQLERES